MIPVLGIINKLHLLLDVVLVAQLIDTKIQILIGVKQFHANNLENGVILFQVCAYLYVQARIMLLTMAGFAFKTVKQEVVDNIDFNKTVSVMVLALLVGMEILLQAIVYRFVHQILMHKMIYAMQHVQEDNMLSMYLIYA